MKVAFCIPGNNFTPRFLTNWTSLTNELTNNKIQFWLSTGYAPVVHLARERVLNIINEDIDFTHVMWIDSDIDFSPKNFFQLLQHNKPVVPGIYRLYNYDNKFSAYINGEWMNRELRANSIKCCEPSLVEAEYTGLGWMLTKIEVYKNLKPPYFNISNKQMEDEMFCRRLNKHGYKINVDPTILVGHEKLQVLR